MPLLLMPFGSKSNRQGAHRQTLQHRPLKHVLLIAAANATCNCTVVVPNMFGPMIVLSSSFLK